MHVRKQIKRAEKPGGDLRVHKYLHHKVKIQYVMCAHNVQSYIYTKILLYNGTAMILIR